MPHLKVLSASTSTTLVALLCCLPLVLAAPPPAPRDVTGGGEWRCAPGCVCSADGLSARCEGVTPQPASLPQGLVSLSARAHQLRQLRNDTFAALPSLQHLDLPDGRISEVWEDALSSLPRLRSLSLSNNELAFVPAGALAGGAALEAVDLSSNPLVLPSVGPLVRSASLRELSLSDCSLRRFTPDTFSQLPALLRLDLSFNSFSQLAPEDVQPFGNLSWLSVDADALSEDALAFLQDNGVEVDVFEAVNTTDDLPPEDRDDDGGAIYLGFLDKEYHYEDDTAGGDYVVLKNVEVAYEPVQQWVNDQPWTGASESAASRRWEAHSSWQEVVVAALVGSCICVSAALAYWAVRRRLAARAAQGPRDTLDRAFRQVSSLPAYQQLQRTPAKSASSGGGYRRLYDEEETPASLPPRAGQPERCTCLSCSEPVPTQPCIRFYEQPASVHGAVPSRYYSLYPTHNQ